ncbi:NTP transferase domain-containing protein [Teichococcus oryzae]|uniref:NTP transferase domain-containing protein n=1 Tax=Teichococcus oryzae TaxID=1608942 RepID=A0A5B2TLS7_9PROT|nr:molybdopterin-binding/glycosyltransferase family 2 protein [Pseudoroseomonas oryzae]KAA2214965.1 NTP transferase domain-containing protein [Pseudoroseomonas oryzae]
MKFGPTPLAEAEGAILAHTIRLPEGTSPRVLKKGTVLDAAALAALRATGHGEIIAARLEPGDIPEDEAAQRLGEALLGPLLARSRAATGRVNILADAAGLFVVDEALVNRLNRLDESLTLATLPNHTPVSAREMLATVKVIPFSAPAAALQLAEVVARGGRALAVHPFRPLKVGLVLSELPGLKDSILEGTVAATEARITALSGSLLPPIRCRHEEGAIAEALGRLKRMGAELLLVAGASAVVDRRDAGPAAIVRAGGHIEHFGMPVDPGNLICLGALGNIPALVLPGCARSPKLNGFDWVLQRLFAGLPVNGNNIAGMGVGGLLKEIETRPLPREQAAAQASSGVAPRRPRQVAALVLAAGRSRRMAPLNKLMVTDKAGVPMVVRVVNNVLESRARPVIAVTGYEAQRVEEALAGRPVLIAHTEDYAEGLSGSLKAGLAALPPEVEGVLVCLGDMPLVTGAMLDRLMAAFDPEEGRSIVMPTFRGKQGNPMLWAREFIPEMLEITGDVGARHLVGKYAEKVVEVEMSDDAVLRDFDTTDALKMAPDFRQPG